MFACYKSLGNQAMPYGVTDTLGKYLIVDTPMFTFEEEDIQT
jgi:hypothetical protein